MRDYNNPQCTDDIRLIAPLCYADLSKTSTMVIIAEMERSQNIQRSMDEVTVIVQNGMQADALLPTCHELVANYLRDLEQAFHHELFKRYCKEYQLDKAIDEDLLDEHEMQMDNPHFDKWIDRHSKVQVAPL